MYLDDFPPRSAGASLKREGKLNLLAGVEETFPRVLRGPH